jgi:hypothetical protein
MKKYIRLKHYFYNDSISSIETIRPVLIDIDRIRVVTCSEKGLANDKRYGELGSREYFLNRHLSKRGRVYEHISEKQKKTVYFRLCR